MPDQPPRRFFANRRLVVGGMFATAAASACTGAAAEKVIRPDGAAGNGRTDDTAPMLAALNRAEATGDPVELAPGAVYALRRWPGFAPRAPLLIRGEGARLIAPDPPTSFLSPAARVELTDLKFDGWSSVVERQVGQGGDLSGSRLERLLVRNARGIAINVECPIHNFVIRALQIVDSRASWAVRIGTNDRRLQDTWTDGLIEDVRLTRLRGAGDVGGALFYGQRMTIIDFVAEDLLSGMATEDSDGACWGLYVKLRHSRIVRPRIINIRAGRPRAECVAINLKGGEHLPATSASPEGHHVIVIEPEVRDFAGLAIRIQNSVTSVERPVLRGRGSLIAMDSPYASRALRVTGGEGVLTGDFGVPGSGIGVSIEGAVSDVRIIDFTMSGVRVAWSVSPAGQPGQGGAKDIYISGGGATVRQGAAPTTDPLLYSFGLALSPFRPIANLSFQGVRLRGGATAAIVVNGGPAAINGLRFSDCDLAARAPVFGKLPAGTVALRTAGLRTPAL